MVKKDFTYITGKMSFYTFMKIVKKRMCLLLAMYVSKLMKLIKQKLFNVLQFYIFIIYTVKRLF